MQSVLLEKKSIEVDFGNCDEIVSLSVIEFVTRTYARAPYSSLRLMVVHFDSVGLEKMSMTLDNLVKMMSLKCFDEFIVETQAWLLYSFVSLIFFQLVVQEKEHVKQIWERRW